MGLGKARPLDDGTLAAIPATSAAGTPTTYAEISAPVTASQTPRNMVDVTAVDKTPEWTLTTGAGKVCLSVMFYLTLRLSASRTGWCQHCLAQTSPTLNSKMGTKWGSERRG